MADDLVPLLAAYNSAALNRMLSFNHVPPPAARGKEQVIARLATALAESRHVEAAYADLGAAERAAIEALQRAGGRLSLRALREALKKQGLVDDKPPTGPVYAQKPPDPSVRQPRRLEDLVARLSLRGLVFATEDGPRGPFVSAATGPGGLRDFNKLPTSIHIPASIRRQLPEPPPPPPDSTPPIKVAVVAEGSARAFQRDLYLYWSYVRKQPLALTNKGEPRKAQLKEVNATLLVRAELGKGESEADHPRLRFVRLLLDALGLLVHRGDEVAAASGEATEFFARPAAERVKQCFATWRMGAFWSDWLLLPRGLLGRGSQAIQGADAGLLAARRLVLEYAGSQPPAREWVGFDALIGQVRSTDYEFLISRRPLSAYDYSPYYGLVHPYGTYGNRFGVEFVGITSEEDGWDKVEANFIRAVITGPLHWMGLVDLGWGKAESKAPPDAFRLTPLGRWLLANGPQPDIPAEGGRVIVQPNLHVVALDPVVDATLVTLDRFAERLSAERAVEYRLTRASVFAGQQHGWEVARIKAFLREQTGADLPGNVARTLDEWQAQHERIVLYPRVTLAHGRPEALDALAARPEAPGLVAARLTPHLLRLAGPEAVPGVVQALGEAGVLPVVTQTATAAPGSVEAREDGTLRLLARQPSLYLHGHLAAVADPLGDDAYAVSAATVQRATRAGLTAPQIVERLQAVHRGPLPDALARRIRAWAKHYGAAALEPVALLQVRDAATLNELLADPDLAGLLQPFCPAHGKALARVRPEVVEKLRALLAERGVELNDKLG